MAAFVLWQGALLALGREPRPRGEAEPRATSDALSRWGLARAPARMSPRELRVLPGIGERLALAIADARRARGRRAPNGGGALAWEDVRGIGPRTAARVRAWLAAHGLETELDAHPGERSSRAADALDGAGAPPAEKTSAGPRPSSAGPAARAEPW